MPTNVFNELDEEKKIRIIEAAIKEFAEYGYENGSTNRIVKECGISKGSLFKYFESKEELYFYLIDIVSSQMAEYMKGDIISLSKDLFERVIEYSSMEISWYMSNPIKGRFLIGVSSEYGSEIGQKIIDRYGKKSLDIYEELLKGVDMSKLHNDMKEIADILRWVLSGFNQSFLLNMQYSSEDIADIKKDYLRQLKLHMKVLRSGL